MPIDTSIYGNIRQPQVESPNVVDSLARAMSLKESALKGQQMQQSVNDQDAVRSAYAKSTAPDGSINRAGFIAELTKTAPHLVQSQQSQFATSDASQADAQKKVTQDKLEKMGAAYRIISGVTSQDQLGPAKQQLSSLGLPVDHIPDVYDPQKWGQFKSQAAMMTLDAKQAYDNTKTQSDVAINEAKAPLDRKKTVAETAKDWAETDKLKREAAQPNLTQGQKTNDETFAKDYSEYYNSGGKAAVEKNLARLQGAIDTLNKSPGLTGGVSTRVPGISSDMAQDSINPQMAQVRDDIRGAIQASLRQVLGAQFTAQEGESIFNRAFNPRLSGPENARRATAELDSLRKMAEQKDAAGSYFQANGTLKGFKPGGTKLPESDGSDLADMAKRFAKGGKGKGDGAIIESTASADEGKQSPSKPVAPPAGTVLMRSPGPNGKLKYVPQSQVAEAIASGGSKVTQ